MDAQTNNEMETQLIMGVQVKMTNQNDTLLSKGTLYIKIRTQEMWRSTYLYQILGVSITENIYYNKIIILCLQASGFNLNF